MVELWWCNHFLIELYIFLFWYHNNNHRDQKTPVQLRKGCCKIHNMWTGLCLCLFISVKPLFTDKERLSTWCLSDKESHKVLPRNLTDFSETGRTEYLFCWSLLIAHFHLKLFPSPIQGFWIWKDLLSYAPIIEVWLHSPKGLESVAERKI